MARIIASSSNLLYHARAHRELGADWIELKIEAERPNCAALSSPTGRTTLPVESQGWYGKGAMLNVPKLIAALTSIEDQPITLDLHEVVPCKLYATDWQHSNLEFDI